jgi:hypothetical protein
MSFFYAKNVTKCLGHHYAIWTRILVGTGVQLKLRKHPNAYIAIKWNLNLLVITFLTTLTPLARVILRNDASPSDVTNWHYPELRGYFTLKSLLHRRLKQVMSLFTLGSARAVLVVAFVYSFPDVLNVIMALISPCTNQPLYKQFSY